MKNSSAKNKSRNQINSVPQTKDKGKKASKGTVVIQVFKGRIRIVWSYLGKRYYLYLGLPDSHINQTVAKQKALQIEGDMATSNFDTTLKKYKPESQKKKEIITVTKLFEIFMEEKAKEVTAKTMEKYQATLGYLQRYFIDESVNNINTNKAEDFARYLQDKKLSVNQCKRRLGELQACWKWGIEKKLITVENPWNDVHRRIKVPPKQKSKPFTREEITKIIQAFREDKYYSCYADFVEFL